MNDYVIAVIVAVAVFLGGLIVRWLVSRRGGDLLGEESRRSMTQFAGVLGVLAGLGWLLIRTNPGTADTLVVSLLRSVPSVLMAVLIVIVAVMLGRAIGTLTSRALRSVSSVLAARIGRAVRLAIVGVGVLIALEQIGVSTELLIIVVTAVVAAASLATALAVGLGSVPLAKNVAAGRHVLNRFEVGQVVSGESFQGKIVDVGLSSVSLDTGAGTLEVPHLLFLEQVVQVSDG